MLTGSAKLEKRVKTPSAAQLRVPENPYMDWQFRFASADQVVRTLDIAAATWVEMFLADSGESLSDRAVG
jgi:hypothetical protein